MIIANQIVEVKWNSSNKKYLESNGYAFTKIGDLICISIDHLSKGSKTIVKAECDWCKSPFTRSMQLLNRKNHSHHFCGNSCQQRFRKHEAEKNKITMKCKQCNEEYKIEKYRQETSNFCSTVCLSRWQSESFSGENSPLYIERYTIECDWCGLGIDRTASKLSKQKYNFCNKRCQQNWHRNIFAKSEEFLYTAKKTMLSNISNGKIKFTETQPHLKICKLLDEMKIDYVNEKLVSDYSFDIYLTKFDQYIEVNGSYWHCDNRLYNEINHNIQLDRIIKDKRKRTYLLNNKNKHTLYLWEQDINNSIEVCKRLILNFIEGCGILENYHSMNYALKSNSLVINHKLLIPYMDRTIESLSSIIDLTVREKVTKYDTSKHITFECEECGELKTQLLRSYEKSKRHFCSVKCHNIAQQKDNETGEFRAKYNCSNCSTEINVQNYVHQKLLSGEQKNIFCSKDCKYKGKKNIL